MPPSRLHLPRCLIVFVALLALKGAVAHNRPGAAPRGHSKSHSQGHASSTQRSSSQSQGKPRQFGMVTPLQHAVEKARRDSDSGRPHRLQGLKDHLQRLASNATHGGGGEDLSRRFLQETAELTYSNANAACRKNFTGVGSRPLKTAAILFTYPRELLSGYTDATVSALYRDDPKVVDYYKKLWRDMFTQSCDSQSMMSINEAYHGMSFGQLTYHGEAGKGGLDVYGVLHLTKKQLDRAVADEVYAEDYLVGMAGATDKQYDLIVYVAVLCGDASDCKLCRNVPGTYAYCGGALGWAPTGDKAADDGSYVPGGVWMGLADNYDMWQQSLLGHELGHRWYDHASTYEFNRTSKKYQHVEYGDVVSVMGGGYHYVTSAMQLRVARLLPDWAFTHVPVAKLPPTSADPPAAVPQGGSVEEVLGLPGVYRLTNTNRPSGSTLRADDLAALVVDLPSSAAWGLPPLNNTYYSFVVQFFKEKPRDGWSYINRWSKEALFPTAGVWVTMVPGAIVQDYITTGEWMAPSTYGMFNDASLSSVQVTDTSNQTDYSFNVQRAKAELLTVPGRTLTTMFTRNVQLKVALLALDPGLEWAVVYVAKGPADQ